MCFQKDLFCVLYWLFRIYALFFPILNNYTVFSFFRNGLEYSGYVCHFQLTNSKKFSSWFPICFRYSQLQFIKKCYIIQHEILMFIILFSIISYFFLLQLCLNFSIYHSCSSVNFMCNFFILMLLVLQILCPVVGYFFSGL